MTISPDSKGWYALDRSVDQEIIGELERVAPIEKLSLTRIPLVTVNLARRLSCLKVDQLWLWCDVTRRAMRHLLQLPGLRVLDVLCIRGPGTLENFQKAASLEVFRANHYMRENDLLQVSRCSQLQELGAQGAELSSKAIASILALPKLASLDLESTRFDDAMAGRLGRSRTIRSLDIGATNITRKGLVHIAEMEQLESLDLWATALNERDLRPLQELPNLEYLSLGNHEGMAQLDSEEVTQIILSCTSLKRVWLDGIRLGPSQRGALEEKLESLRITSVGDGA